MMKMDIAKPLTFLPPHAECCQICAVKHAEDMPHNAQSLYYQMTFHEEHGRWPSWATALAHCSPEMREAWRGALSERGAWLPAFDTELAEYDAMRDREKEKAREGNG